MLQIRKVMFRRLLQEYPEIALALRSRMTRGMLQAAGELNQVAQRLGAIQI